MGVRVAPAGYETDMRKRLFQDYGLSLTLAALFLVSWIAQLLFTIPVAYNEAIEHGSQFAWKEFWPEFFKDTFENWQSEFLQLLTFVVLTRFLIHKGSHESKDSSDRMEAKVDQILAAMKPSDGVVD
jgi:hypothetical protein